MLLRCPSNAAHSSVTAVQANAADPAHQANLGSPAPHHRETIGTKFVSRGQDHGSRSAR